MSRDESDKKKSCIDNIERFINYYGYTWSVDSLLIEYDKYLNGSYISFTAKHCIEACRNGFEYLYRN